MNPVGSLNLATHDDGIAAISNFPLALDWLAIALPNSSNAAAIRFSQQFPTSSTPQSTQPRISSTVSSPDPITNKQAASSLVRYFRSSSNREVLAPCFRVASRFILGRSLGDLFIPSELGLPHLRSEQCGDARFVLDLQHGSIVETRQYTHSKSVLCIAYAARQTEFLSLPPQNFCRVEITYTRDESASSGHQNDILFSQGPQPSISQSSWHHFCLNYSSIFPTGPLLASVSSDPGPANETLKRETITVTTNDSYAMNFALSHPSSRTGGSQARRIAPRRLLPRPTS